MAINVQSLFDSMKARFGAEHASDKFQEIYFDCWRQVKADLEIECGLDFDAPEGMTPDLSLDAKYYTVISTGIMFHIATHGEWLIEDASKFETRYNNAKKFATMARMKDDSALTRLGDLS